MPFRNPWLQSSGTRPEYESGQQPQGVRASYISGSSSALRKSTPHQQIREETRRRSHDLRDLDLKRGCQLATRGRWLEVPMSPPVRKQTTAQRKFVPDLLIHVERSPAERHGTPQRFAPLPCSHFQTPIGLELNPPDPLGCVEGLANLSGRRNEGDAWLVANACVCLRRYIPVQSSCVLSQL